VLLYAGHLPMLIGFLDTNMRNFKVIVTVGFCLLSLNACKLITTPLLDYGDLSPTLYCPGDELTASYTFLDTATCPAGMDCSLYHPTVTMSSAPALFPLRTTTNYLDSFTFRSSGDSVTVNFIVDRGSVLIPTDRFDERGYRIFNERTQYVYPGPEQHTADLYTGQQQMIRHDGMCAGSSPAYRAGLAWAAPEVSSSLVANTLCNESTVPIIATVSYRDEPGVIATPMDIALNVRECRDLTRADVPVSPTPSRIAVRPQLADTSARCGSAVEADVLPRNLNTSLRFACR
jgi:hypothetical protein